MLSKSRYLNGLQCPKLLWVAINEPERYSVPSVYDLMYDCWRCNLKGGFKAVEQQLGIPRQLQGINGWDAVLLWQRYRNYGDGKALATLLKYNEEDVVNLKVLREKLSISGYSERRQFERTEL